MQFAEVPSRVINYLSFLYTALLNYQTSVTEFLEGLVQKKGQALQGAPGAAGASLPTIACCASPSDRSDKQQ